MPNSFSSLSVSATLPLRALSLRRRKLWKRPNSWWSVKRAIFNVLSQKPLCMVCPIAVNCMSSPRSSNIAFRRSAWCRSSVSRNSL